MKLFPDNASLDDKLQHAIIFVLRLSLLVATGLAVAFARWELLFLNIMALVLSFLPLLIERNYKVNLPLEFELVIVLFIYAAMFLGEVMNFYENLWWWDGMLHVISGIVLSFAGFLGLYTMQHQQRLKISAFGLVFLAFCIAMAAGAVWEIFEFSADQIFGLNMQKNGLHDTMWDLIVDGLGALLISGLGYWYIKDHSVKFLDRLINSFLTHNPHLNGKGAKS